MIHRRFLPLLAVALGTASLLPAQKGGLPEGSKTLSIGDPAPAFSLKGIDGKMHTLDEYKDAKLLCVFFTCNHCPSAQAVEERLKAFVEKYEPQGVKVVAINPNDPSALRLEEVGFSMVSDSYEDMIVHAKANGFNFPYLYDGDTQEVAKAYGALATPHVFLFDEKRKLRYHGYFDDSRFAPEVSVKHRGTEEAVVALLAGKEVPKTTTKPHGCSTKWSYKKGAVTQYLADLKAAEVTLEDVEPAKLKQILSGGKRYCLVNLWATWCAPCVQEMPELVHVSRKFGLRDFEMITICLDKEAQRKQAEQFLGKMGAAPSKKLAGALKKEGDRKGTALFWGDSQWDALAHVVDPDWSRRLPHTVLISPDGEILFRQEGRIDSEELTTVILEHMGRYFVPRK